MALPFYNPYKGSIGRFFSGDTSLVGYWQLQGNSWDNSGNGYNGTDTAVTYNQPGFRDGVGSAYFNGTTSKIITSSPSQADASPYTLMGWINITPGATLYYTPIISLGNGGIESILTLESPTLIGIDYPGSNNLNATIPSIIAGKDYLLCVTYNGAGSLVSSAYSFYVNGIFYPNSGSFGGTAALLPTSTGVNLGYDAFAPRYLNGRLSEASRFSRTLSHQEISQYYQWATSSNNLPHKWRSLFVQAAQNVAGFFMSWFTAN